MPHAHPLRRGRGHQEWFPFRQMRVPVFAQDDEEIWGAWGAAVLQADSEAVIRGWIYATACGRPRASSILGGRLLPTEVMWHYAIQVGAWGIALGDHEVCQPNAVATYGLVGSNRLRAAMRKGQCTAYLAGQCGFGSLPGQRHACCTRAHFDAGWAACGTQSARTVSDQGSKNRWRLVEGPPGVGRIHSTLLDVTNPDLDEGDELGYSLNDISEDLQRELTFKGPFGLKELSRRGECDRTEDVQNPYSPRKQPWRSGPTASSSGSGGPGAA